MRKESMCASICLVIARQRPLDTRQAPYMYTSGPFSRQERPPVLMREPPFMVSGGSVETEDYRAYLKSCEDLTCEEGVDVRVDLPGNGAVRGERFGVRERLAADRVRLHLQHCLRCRIPILGASGFRVFRV